ncbi:hypothetical protein [Sphingomonas lenta]|uniref:Uncharacterized protein n=1 Tax=Sphingomonas lenta TaxID=1141887 RepID=A0A2A2SFP0_9SPHN|nr:hypothetical protein [Sphingomonas lenta]PAX08076.1 hypothetical protein CKY28_10830 [Sphingomonas lenta]
MLKALAPLLLLAAPATAQSPPVPAAAQAQLDELARAVQRYRDVRAAQAAGWEPSPIGREDSPLMGEHWVRKGAPEYGPGEPLDFTEPSNLQYAWINGRRELVGVSYVVRIAPGDPLPRGFAGDADRWHVHDVERAVAAATEGRWLLRVLVNGWLDANYRSKGDDRSRLAMVHAWVTVPSPNGVFSTNNRAISYLRAGLPASFANGGTAEAALGVNLAAKDGCANTLNGAPWIAHAKDAQKRSLLATCEALGAEVRRGLASGARAVNAAGEAAWAKLEAAKRATLTPDQLRRIDAITEHDPMHHEGHGGHHGS